MALLVDMPWTAPRRMRLLCHTQKRIRNLLSTTSGCVRDRSEQRSASNNKQSALIGAQRTNHRGCSARIKPAAVLGPQPQRFNAQGRTLSRPPVGQSRREQSHHHRSGDISVAAPISCSNGLMVYALGSRFTDHFRRAIRFCRIAWGRRLRTSGKGGQPSGYPERARR